MYGKYCIVKNALEQERTPLSSMKATLECKIFRKTRGKSEKGNKRAFDVPDGKAG